MGARRADAAREGSCVGHGGGLCNKRLARRFGNSVKMVKTHRGALMRKVDAYAVANVVRYAARNNMTSLWRCHRRQGGLGF